MAPNDSTATDELLVEDFRERWHDHATQLKRLKLAVPARHDDYAELTAEIDGLIEDLEQTVGRVADAYEQGESE